MNRGMFSSLHVEWATPQALFVELHREFRFTLDAAATPGNAKVGTFYTATEDGLAQPWVGRVFCNPPYGRAIGRWVAKGAAAARGGAAQVVVMLLPARTDTAWWHEHVMGADEIRFIRGRIHFNDAGPAPFPSAVVVWRGVPA